MRKLFALGLLLAACTPAARPVIDSFTSDVSDIAARDPVVLSWSVRDADVVSILPDIGAVTGNSLTVNPEATIVYTLRASNHAGFSLQTVTINVDGPPRPATIDSFYATPAIVPPGDPTTLKWTVSRAAKIELITPTGTLDVSSRVQMVVPATTTASYQLKVTGPKDTTSPTPATAMVRVSPRPIIASFTANATTIGQGDPVVLSWTGTAASWSIFDGTASRLMGTATSVTVRPQATVTYTLTGRSAGGSPVTQDLPITVTRRTGTSFSYTAPASGGSEALELAADPCAVPCATITFHLKARSATAARGMALDLPLDPNKVDSTKVSIAALSPAPAFNNAVSGMALGKGPLQDVLVLGVSQRGNGGQPAGDVALGGNQDLATFTLSLNGNGGIGTVFDGASAAGDPRFAFELRGQASNPGGIAIGRLDVQ